MRGARPLEWGTLLLAGGFYLVNKGLLIPHTAGPLGWFLACYANDLLAGAAMMAWLHLLLGLGRLPRPRGLGLSGLYLLACGAVWECLSPLWKAGAVFDPWDFLAYLLGGWVYLWISNALDRRRAPCT